MITNFFKPQSKEMLGSTAKPRPRAEKQPKAARKRRCTLVDSEAELSGDGHSGQSEDEWSDGEKQRQERFISDEPVREKRRRLPRVSAAEKVVNEDKPETLEDNYFQLLVRSVMPSGWPRNSQPLDGDCIISQFVFSVKPSLVKHAIPAKPSLGQSKSSKAEKETCRQGSPGQAKSCIHGAGPPWNRDEKQ